MKELRKFFVIEAPIKSESGFESRQPLMQKTGKRKITLLAWTTNEAAESFLQRFDKNSTGQYIVCLASKEYFQRLRMDNAKIGYSVSLKLID